MRTTSLGAIRCRNLGGSNDREEYQGREWCSNSVREHFVFDNLTLQVVGRKKLDKAAKTLNRIVVFGL